MGSGWWVQVGGFKAMVRCEIFIKRRTITLKFESRDE